MGFWGILGHPRNLQKFPVFQGQEKSLGNLVDKVTKDAQILGFGRRQYIQRIWPN